MTFLLRTCRDALGWKAHDLQQGQRQWCLEQEVEVKSFSQLHHPRAELPLPVHMPSRNFLLGKILQKRPWQVKCQPNRYSGYSSCMKTEPPRVTELVNTKGFALPLCCGRDSVRIHVHVNLCAVVAYCALTRLSLWDHRSPHLWGWGLQWRQ